MEPNPWVVLAGLFTTAMTAILTTVGASRGRRTDQIIQTLTEVRAWSDDLRDSEEACRRELEKVRKEVEILRGEVVQLRRQIKEDLA